MSRPRFIVDTNVGRLARWLRALGYDTLFINPIADEELIRTALAEERIVLTKDTGLAQRRVATSGHLRVILVEGRAVQEQLQQVVDTLQLDCRSHRFSRCLECNALLQPKAKAAVREKVPPRVYERQQHFTFCPQCRRIFWMGRHWERMQQELEKLSWAVGAS